MDRESAIGASKTLAQLMGMLMLGAGVAVTIVLLVTLGQLLFTPESIAAVQTISDFLASQAPLLVADVDGKISSINMDEGARLILFYFVGAFIVIALGSVLHALIGGGLSLLRFGNGSQ